MDRDPVNAVAPVNATDPIRRDSALDMVKGMLVIGMLIIHSSTLFLEQIELRRLIYPDMLGFVSGSWLLVSGYLLGLHYKSSFVSTPAVITYRLLNRGWRLVVIFVVSNLLLGRISLLDCLANGSAARCDLTNIFLVGDGTLAFEVLLGIGYVLMFAPFILWLSTRVMVVVVLTWVIFLSVIQAAGVKLPMLSWMLACGFAGILLGSFLHPGEVQRILIKHRGVVIFAALSFWAAYALLTQSHVVKMTSPFFYIAQIVAILSLLYLVGEKMLQVGWLNRPMTVMAHYSLLAYIGQIALLQFLNYLLPDESWLRGFVSSFTLVLFILLGGLYLLSYLRGRLSVVDKVYRAVFG